MLEGWDIVITEQLSTPNPDKDKLRQEISKLCANPQVVTGQLILEILGKIGQQNVQSDNISPDEHLKRQKRLAVLITHQLVPKIDCFEKTLQLYPLVQQKHDVGSPYAYIRKETNFFRREYGNTASWGAVMFVVKSKLAEQMSQEKAAVTSEQYQQFYAMQKTHRFHEYGFGIFVTPNSVKPQNEFNTIRMFYKNTEEVKKEDVVLTKKTMASIFSDCVETASKFGYCWVGNLKIISLLGITIIESARFFKISIEACGIGHFILGIEYNNNFYAIDAGNAQLEPSKKGVQIFKAHSQEQLFHAMLKYYREVTEKGVRCSVKEINAIKATLITEDDKINLRVTESGLGYFIPSTDYQVKSGVEEPPKVPNPSP